jgi:hypothetical protein
VGNIECAEYAIKQFLITRTKEELNRIRAQVQRASDDFKDKHPDKSDPDEAIRTRNADSHLPFARLQSELLIPTIAQGRNSALSFYYGKILGSINDLSMISILTMLAKFERTLIFLGQTIRM